MMVINLVSGIWFAWLCAQYAFQVGMPDLATGTTMYVSHHHVSSCALVLSCQWLYTD